MDILHAYWRMDYVTSGTTDRADGLENPFSELPLMGDDRKALIVHRARHHYLLLNRYPYNPGHLLIVPYRTVTTPGELEPPERLEMMDMIAFSQDLLTRSMKPAAFNVGFNLGRESGAGIPQHLHCHVVPRWNGDTNFISVIGETRTLPQALDQTWEVLTGCLRHA